MIMTNLRFTFLIVLLAIVVFPRFLHAHRDDYLEETLVYLTLEGNETELEYWFDYVDDGRSFFRHNVAVEHGFTDKWMIDGRVTLTSGLDESSDLDSGRLETRYRFFEEGSKPMDIAISGEINTQRSEDGSRQVGIEPRLILSKDIQEKLNLTLNLSEEIPVNSGDAAFNTAFGFRGNISSLLRAGLELKYDFHEREASFIPQVWFTFPHGVTLIMGYSKGFRKSRSSFGRVAVEVEF